MCATCDITRMCRDVFVISSPYTTSMQDAIQATV